VNEPGEDETPSADRSSRKRRKGVEAELVEENENAGPSTTAMPRRSLRKTKAEAVEAAQEEASSAGASQPTRTSKRRKK
jgi:non-structural maintenance of chromosomes element 1